MTALSTKRQARSTMAAKAAKKPAPRKRGRPTSEDAARETFQLRVTTEQRTPWKDAATASAQTESEWARAGLDAWALVTKRATQLGADARTLVAEAIEDHARVRAAVAELLAVRSPSTTEQRLLRVLAPSEWARRHASQKG